MGHYGNKNVVIKLVLKGNLFPPHLLLHSPFHMRVSSWDYERNQLNVARRLFYGGYSGTEIPQLFDPWSKSVPLTNLHCASRRTARSRCGSISAWTCPPLSPRCSGQRWPAAFSLTWPAPPSAEETAWHWRLGSWGLGWASLDEEDRSFRGTETV